MAWSALVPTAPPDFQEMLNNQTSYAGRYSGQTLPTANEYTGVKGNPFFTATNQPGQTSVTTSTRAPFTWEGDNDSLRKAYEQSYNAYWAGVPSTSTFNRTWDGPEIRPLYAEQHGGFNDGYNNIPTSLDFGGGSAGTPQERQRQVSTGLQNIGTRNYWQDNNKNNVFEAESDDYLDTSSSYHMDNIGAADNIYDSISTNQDNANAFVNVMKGFF